MLDKSTQIVVLAMAEYLRKVTGWEVEVASVSESALVSLPFFIRDRYFFVDVAIDKRHFFAAIFSGQTQRETPGQLTVHLAHMTKALDHDVALIFSELPNYVRARLMSKQIPFIAGRQHLYLPFLAMDLQAKGRRTMVTIKRGHISYPSQCLLLFHLQKEDITGVSLSTLALKLDVSIMTLSRVLKELIALSLCDEGRDGTKKSFRFIEKGQVFWSKAFPLMRSPVKRTAHAILSDTLRARLPLAGLSSLSRRSMLSDDTISTCAVSLDCWRQGIESGDIVELEQGDDSGARVEIWGYDPVLLMGEPENNVDSLSLYLSLSNDPDERVQVALEELMIGISWSRV